MISPFKRVHFYEEFFVTFMVICCFSKIQLASDHKVLDGKIIIIIIMENPKFLAWLT